MAEGDVDRLVHQEFFQNSKTGVCVEVGAARPDYLSISTFFRQLGWRVIAVEPNPAFCETHRQRGYEVLQYACGDHDEDDVDFFIVDLNGASYEGGAVSFESFSSLGLRDSYRTLFDSVDNATTTPIKVKLRRLDTILQTHASDVEHIDVLSIDVEGWELQVLAGLDIPRFQPRVMIIENLFDSEAYRSRLSELGYTLWKKVPPNEVYIPHDSAEARLLRRSLWSRLTSWIPFRRQ